MKVQGRKLDLGGLSIVLGPCHGLMPPRNQALCCIGLPSAYTARVAHSTHIHNHDPVLQTVSTCLAGSVTLPRSAPPHRNSGLVANSTVYAGATCMSDSI